MSEAPPPVQRCSVCEHASVLGINNAILNSKSYRAIARDFRIGSERSGEFKPDHSKVRRHVERCMATSYQAIQETNLTAQGKAIQTRLQELDEYVDTVLKDALEGDPIMVGDTPLLDEKTGDILRRRNLRVILAAVREGRHNSVVKAKLAGAMPEEGDGSADAARAALEDPQVRKLIQEMEQRMADLEAAAGRDRLDAT